MSIGNEHTGTCGTPEEKHLGDMYKGTHSGGARPLDKMCAGRRKNGHFEHPGKATNVADPASADAKSDGELADPVKDEPSDPESVSDTKSGTPIRSHAAKCGEKKAKPNPECPASADTKESHVDCTMAENPSLVSAEAETELVTDVDAPNEDLNHDEKPRNAPSKKKD